MKATGWAAAAAAAVAALGALDLVQHYGYAAGPAVGLGVLRVAPWLLLRTRPAPAWALSLGATLVTAAAAHPVGPAEPWPWAVTSVLAALPVAAVCGARLPRAGSAAVLASAAAAGAVPLLLAPDRGGWSGLVAPVVLVGVALLAGDLARGRAEARTGLGAERVRAEALEERARIAREMHDVVAHGLALVTVRADSAPVRVPDVSPAAAAEFAAIGDAARGTLTELRGLLGVLRGPAADAARPGPGDAPQPGLADLPGLVASSRAAGLPVALSTTGDGTDLPPVLQLTAYRLVQEALSNVLRHAPGAAATVRLERTPAALLVTVTDTGTGGVLGTGHGLTGMRERVAAVGGTVTAGPEDGRWRVAATLPVPA